MIHETITKIATKHAAEWYGSNDRTLPEQIGFAIREAMDTTSEREVLELLSQAETDRDGWRRAYNGLFAAIAAASRSGWWAHKGRWPDSPMSRQTGIPTKAATRYG